MLALLLPLAAGADELRYEIGGLAEPLLGNVRSHLQRFGFAETARLSAGRFDEVAAEAEERIRAALKPYGYYRPEIVANLAEAADGNYLLRIQVRAGEPVRVARADVSIRGAGEQNGPLQEWLRDWPLPAGSVLDQPAWEATKSQALAIAESNGYLQAQFSAQRIAIDLEANTAVLTLRLDTGAQAVFGDVRYQQQELRPWVLETVPRFAPGDPYNTELLGQFRLDLWRTGYFDDIEVREERHLDASPPRVDLLAILRSGNRETYQGTLGFGTDTGIRAQGLWSRHRLSSRGDRLDIGTGYRELDDELSVRADYRVPRRTERRTFWVASGSLRSENQDLEFKRDANDEGFVKLASGDVEDVLGRFGRLYVRDRKRGFQQILETVFVQFVRESFDYRPGAGAAPEVIAVSEDPRFAGLFRNTITTLAFGIEWDWPAVSGQGFDTEGHRERAWLFTANEAWGSERDFSQIYLSSRRSYLYGDDWKLLLRAEVGYSDAEVRQLAGTVNGEDFSLSVTQLPDTYRFKAGGSSSVRGYGFEELSNNDIGSNHVVTGSIEVERRIVPNWSVAVFADIGNAFNDWSRRDLKRGVGAGVRWYSIAGPIRVDVARALDVEGKPWSLHFTMGSPLL